MAERYSRGWGYRKWGPPPEGYIAGLGRGAVGFITRSDIGPGQVGVQAPAREENLNDANYDEWSGHQGNLFAGLKEDNEDKEADKALSKVDDFMTGRRSKKQLEKLKERQQAFEDEKVNYKAYF